MRLSEGVEWGVHCATLLAVLPPGASLSAARLAEFHGVPEAYLGKHLQALSRAGIVESVPGRRGGYCLSRPPGEITLADVLEAIDGDEAAFRCTEIRQRGPAGLPPEVYRVPCAIHAAMLRADRAWRRELQTTTIAEILGQMARGVSPEAVMKSAQTASRQSSR